MEIEWNAIYEAVKDGVVALLGLILLALVATLKDTLEKKLKTSEDLENYRKLREMAEVAVAAAEQKYKAMREAGVNLPETEELKRGITSVGAMKKEYAMTILRDKFPNMDIDTLDAYVESAVSKLAKNFSEITSNRSTEDFRVTNDSGQRVTIRGEEVNK